MKTITQYIIENLQEEKQIYKYHPKKKYELQKLLKQLIGERGNEGNFNDIDTSKIEDMSDLLRTMQKFNGNISNWDVSSVTDMGGMFFGCDTFNQDISNWDVSNVKNMKMMFSDCKSFNQDISNWDVSHVEYNNDMFINCPIKEKYKPKFN